MNGMEIIFLMKIRWKYINDKNDSGNDFIIKMHWKWFLR